MKSLGLIPLLALTACTHLPPPAVVVREVPVAMASTNRLDELRYPSHYRAYSVGRRPDPSNPNILHDGYVLYIRDQPERWNLQPSERPIDLPGAPRPAAEVPLPLDEQLRLELRKQKQAALASEAQSERLRVVAESLPLLMRSTSAIATNVDMWQKRVDDRLRLLEAGGTLTNTSSPHVITNQ